MVNREHLLQLLYGICCEASDTAFESFDPAQHLAELKTGLNILYIKIVSTEKSAIIIRLKKLNALFIQKLISVIKDHDE
jgi:hypothetical protein